MSKLTAFYAYAAEPAAIGTTIEEAINKVQESSQLISISSWKALDIVGHFISEKVLTGIDYSDIFIADISVLNFNVTYEIGYAIGKKKRILLTKNLSLKEVHPTIRDVGIYDTLGFKEYQNSTSLCEFIVSSDKNDPLDFSLQVDTKAPVYLLDTKHKTDWATRIVSRVKKARYIFRTFDPNESPRLSAYDAISQVAKSHGIIVPLLAMSVDGCEVNNMRAAFIAGLADGMGKDVCMLQEGDGPVPLDYRDFVNTTYKLNDINEHIANFASRVATAFQQGKTFQKDETTTFLQALDLGASSAENEMRSLENYYLKTDQFLKSLRGEAHLVVGRKGSGKSAIFLQIRDRERSKSENIVLDLKPDGYKLIKFKEMILDFLEEGTFQHTIMAFWEYVLLLEICHKILEKDRKTHIRDPNLYEPYRELFQLYNSDGYLSEGDFSERLSTLMDKITTTYLEKYSNSSLVRLSVPQVTEILYSHDVKSLTETVINYMKNKGVLWLLFDNIDKGWPTSGLKHEDLILIRALLDATRKIERNFDKRKIEVNTIVFLRNDVYELLVCETSDRGKEANVLLDWTDADLLKELIRLRIVSNDINNDLEFDELWRRVCISHYKGEESMQYLIDRSLMRPRFLINLINQCKSFAVNLNHLTIEEDDIKKGISAFSTDLITDIGFEINDIAPEAKDILYAFIESKPLISKNDLFSALRDFGVEDSKIDDILHILIWYGFLGLQINSAHVKYIYDFNYNMQLPKGILKKKCESQTFVINPAFYPALMIDD